MEIKLNKEESNKLRVLLECEILNKHYFPLRRTSKIFENILEKINNA